MEFDFALFVVFKPSLQVLSNTKQDASTFVQRIQEINRLKEWIKEINQQSLYKSENWISRMLKR